MSLYGITISYCFELALPVVHESSVSLYEESRLGKGIGSAMYWMAFYNQLRIGRRTSGGLIVLTHSAAINDSVANNQHSAKIWTGIVGQVRKTKLKPINTAIYLPNLGDWTP